MGRLIHTGDLNNRLQAYDGFGALRGTILNIIDSIVMDCQTATEGAMRVQKQATEETEEQKRAQRLYEIHQKREAYRWIPCDERLPEDRRIVLVTAYWHETYQVMEASYYGLGLWWCVPFNNCGEHMQRLKPIAWMELPKPYKKEGEHE